MGISKEAQKIFVITKKYFSINTVSCQRKVKVFDMVKSVIENVLVIEIYKSLLSSCDVEVSTEVAKVVLYNIVCLYMKVRAHSFSKKIEIKVWETCITSQILEKGRSS